MLYEFHPDSSILKPFYHIDDMVDIFKLVSSDKTSSLRLKCTGG